MTKTETLKPLGVMLLDDNVERAAMVERSLLDNEFRVLSMLSSSAGLLNQIEQHKPDIIIIDLESPDRDVLESLSIISDHNPTPIVMFSQKNDPDFVSEAVKEAEKTADSNPSTLRVVKGHEAA